MAGPDLKKRKMMSRSAEEILKEARRLMAEQVRDQGLWFNTETVSEAYLQGALRKMHAVVEDNKTDKNVFLNDPSDCMWPHEVDEPIRVFDEESFKKYKSGEYKVPKVCVCGAPITYIEPVTVVLVKQGQMTGDMIMEMSIPLTHVTLNLGDDVGKTEHATAPVMQALAGLKGSCRDRGDGVQNCYNCPDTDCCDNLTADALERRKKEQL